VATRVLRYHVLEEQSKDQTSRISSNLYNYILNIFILARLWIWRE